MPPLPRRYFLTEHRLKNIPHFYKTVKMIGQVNPNQEIHLPKKAEYWFSNHWYELSIGNIVLVIENGGTISSVGDHEEVTRKIYKEALLTSNHTYLLRDALRSRFLQEEDVNTFIDTRLTKRIKEVGSDELHSIIGNSETKVYQLERCWKIQPDMTYFGERAVLARIPNYILDGLLNQAVKYEESSSHHYYGSTESEAVFRECLLRGLLQKGLATKFIGSELKTLPHKKTASAT